MRIFAEFHMMQKKEGGIRPTAIGTTLFRLVAKMCSCSVKSALGTGFRSIEFGFG